MEFSGSQAFSDTLEALKQRFGPMLGLLAVFFVIQLVAMFAFGLVSAGLGMSGTSSELALGSIVVSLVSNLVNFYLSSASSAALTTTASPISKSPFSEAFAIGFRSAPWLLLCLLLMGIGCLAAGLVVALLAFAIGAIAGKAAAVLLAVVAGLPAMLYAGTKLSMLTPVVVVDGVRNPVEAIVKSWRMTDGAALQIFLIFLAFGAAALVLVLVFFAPVLGTVITAVTAGETPDVAGMAGSIGWAFLGMLILVMLLPIVSAALVAAMHAQLSSDARGKIGDTFA